MKALLTRLALRRIIGLVVEPKRIVLSVVVTTPLGRREVHRGVQDRDDQPLGAVLARLLAPWIGPGRGKKAGRGPWVQVSLPEAQVFQATAPVTHANRNATPEAYFLEAVQATNARAEERIIDLLKLDLGRQTLACLAATPRGPITELVEKLHGLGARVGGAVSVPAALFRAGRFYLKSPRNSKLMVRFFLGQGQAIGVVAAGTLPLFWHVFDLPAGDVTAAVRAAYTTLWMIARDIRIPFPIDTVIVHGRRDLALKQDPEEFRRRTGARWLRCPEPGYDSSAAALGSALANPLGEEVGHDLARSIKSPVAIRDIFPWAELALHGGLIAAASVFLNAMASEENARLQAVLAEQKSFAWLKDQPQRQLDAEKKDLEERSRVIDEFHGHRVDWSGPLRTIAAAAPESTVITALQGDAPLEIGGKSVQGKPKQKLLVNFATPLTDEGAMPREIDGFLAALRGDSSLVRQFPLIEVSGLRSNRANRGGRPFASYSVICLPKAEPTKKAAPRPAGKS